MQTRFRTGRTLICAAAFLVCGSGTSGEAALRSEDVVVKAGATSFTRGKTIYSLSDGRDSGELTFNPKTADLEFQVRRSITGLPTVWTVPVTRKMELLRPLMERFFKETGKAVKYTFAIAHFDEESPRLWNSVAGSKDWDLRAGRPTHGDTASFIKNVLERSGAYSELAETVAMFGYEVQVGAIERIVILPVRQFPENEGRKISVTLKPEDQLPYAWSEYFILKRKE